MQVEGDKLIWTHGASMCVEIVEFVRFGCPSRVGGTPPRVVVRTYDGREFAVHAQSVCTLKIPLEATSNPESLLRAVGRFVDLMPAFGLKATDDPRMHARATVGLMALLIYLGRFERPGSVYWATVQLVGDEKLAYDCGHRHRLRGDAIRCALAGGPSQTVVRWSRGTLDVQADAEVALWLWLQSYREPIEWTHLRERWDEQRIAHVFASHAGGVTYRDGSQLGGPKHGTVEDSERHEEGAGAASRTAQGDRDG